MYKISLAFIERETYLSLPKPTGKMPSAEEVVRMMDRAGRQPWVVEEINRFEKWRQKSAKKDRFYG